jgi:uncharacterized membrane protein HdeD (DUF308 family)
MNADTLQSRATSDSPFQWVLAGRAVLAMIFGLSEGAMFLFAFWAPRITAALMATFFTGFAFLDGTMALVGAARAVARGGRWMLLVCKGLVGVMAGIAVVFQPHGATPRPLAIFGWWAVVTGLLQVVEAVHVGAHRGRSVLAVTAVLSLGFGGMVLLRPPGGLLTLTICLAAYGLLLGGLRIALAMRLDSPQLI